MGEIEENLVDGACGMPLPILAGVKRFRPDTLIVLAAVRIASTCRASSSGRGGCSPARLLRHMPVGLRRSAAAMSRAMATEADRLERLKRIAWCRVTPNGTEVPIEPWTTDLRPLRHAAEEAKVFMRDALTHGEACPADLGSVRGRLNRDPRAPVIPGLVPGIHPSTCSGICGDLDPGNKCRDDAEFVDRNTPNNTQRI